METLFFSIVVVSIISIINIIGNVNTVCASTK